MTFRPADALRGGRSLRWRPLAGEGLEHLTIRTGDAAIEASSTVIGGRGGVPYGISYHVSCDLNWRVTSFDIASTDGRRLAMTATAEGWRDAAGLHDRRFDAAIDIDLAGTPFTNTLPIRRLDWDRDAGPARLTMLYVPFDTLEPLVDGQTYTRLAPRLFRYQAQDRSFAADLPVDEDGLVTDYPTLFQRL